MLHHQIAVKVKSNFDNIVIVMQLLGLLDHIYSKIVIYIACLRLLNSFENGLKAKK